MIDYMQREKVCKTFIRRFDPDPRLHPTPSGINHLQLKTKDLRAREKRV